MSNCLFSNIIMKQILNTVITKELKSTCTQNVTKLSSLPTPENFQSAKLNRFDTLVKWPTNKWQFSASTRIEVSLTTNVKISEFKFFTEITRIEMKSIRKGKTESYFQLLSHLFLLSN